MGPLSRRKVAGRRWSGRCWTFRYYIQSGDAKRPVEPLEVRARGSTKAEARARADAYVRERYTPAALH